MYTCIVLDIFYTYLLTSYQFSFRAWIPSRYVYNYATQNQWRNSVALNCVLMNSINKWCAWSESPALRVKLTNHHGTGDFAAGSSRIHWHFQPRLARWVLKPSSCSLALQFAPTFLCSGRASLRFIIVLSSGGTLIFCVHSLNCAAARDERQSMRCPPVLWVIRVTSGNCRYCHYGNELMLWSAFVCKNCTCAWVNDDESDCDDIMSWCCWLLLPLWHYAYSYSGAFINVVIR